jgi:hypothetical protein
VSCALPLPELGGLRHVEGNGRHSDELGISDDHDLKSGWKHGARRVRFTRGVVVGGAGRGSWTGSAMAMATAMAGGGGSCCSHSEQTLSDHQGRPRSNLEEGKKQNAMAPPLTEPEERRIITVPGDGTSKKRRQNGRFDFDVVDVVVGRVLRGRGSRALRGPFLGAPGATLTA